MIPDIKNTFLRRFAIIWTVASVVICLGPLYVFIALIEWFEDEFQTDLRAAWRGDRAKETK